MRDDLGFDGDSGRGILAGMQAVMCMTAHPDEDDHLCTEPPGHPPPHICDGCKITWIDGDDLDFDDSWFKGLLIAFAILAGAGGAVWALLSAVDAVICR